jgi:hypothetical protein
MRKKKTSKAPEMTLDEAAAMGRFFGGFAVSAMIGGVVASGLGADKWVPATVVFWIVLTVWWRDRRKKAAARKAELEAHRSPTAGTKTVARATPARELTLDEARAQLIGLLKRIQVKKFKLKAGQLPETDDFVDWGEDWATYPLDKVDLEITYLDSNEQLSRRTISLLNAVCQFDGTLLIHAYCHSREANRSFKVHRIMSMDLDGQALDPKTYIRFLIEQSPQWKREQLEKQNADVMTVLLYIACLGTLSKKKREIITDYLTVLTKTLVTPDTIRRYDIPVKEFRAAVKKINLWEPAERQKLKYALGAMQGKTPDPIMAASIDILKD